MIRIRTSSRLHFGLFSLPSLDASAWLNQEGQAVIPRRQFGGVGLMVDRPGIDLTIAPAKSWAFEGALAQRAQRFAEAYCDAAGVKESFHIRVAAAAPEHAGLGTGTQLGLAVAHGIAQLAGQEARDTATLARHLGRGHRSALGIRGFDHGGFLVEGGKTAGATLSPLLSRTDFPPEWGILLILPAGIEGVHGAPEIDAFADLAAQERHNRHTETLCRLVLLGMLPALIERDLDTFGECLYDFNRRVGEMFERAQGGLYAHPRIEQIVKGLRELGVKGVGQSSWGGTVFAIIPQEQAPKARAELIRRHLVTELESRVTSACNHGANVTKGAPGESTDTNEDGSLVPIGG